MTSVMGTTVRSWPPVLRAARSPAEDLLRARGIADMPEAPANAGGVIFIGQHAPGHPAGAARREIRRLLRTG